MYYLLTRGLTRRTIRELRQWWSRYPRLGEAVTDNIQGKYSFRERPQHGIIVKTESATPVRLSADNFKGVVHSYSYLAQVRGYPGTSLEWVVDDKSAISRNDQVMPSPPGVYYLTVTDFDDSQSSGNVIEFEIDPLLDVYDESPVETDSSSQIYTVSSGAFLDGSLRVTLYPQRLDLVEGTEYIADPQTGEITILRSLREDDYIRVDYRYRAPRRGPFYSAEMYGHHEAIPGVFLAFGKKAQEGDRHAIVVSDRREPTSFEYGGRFDLSVSLEIFSRDVQTQEYMVDETLVPFIWTRLYPRWSTEGLEITEASYGGGSEEPYDDTAEDFYYTGNISMTVQTEWAAHFPIMGRISQFSPLTPEQQQEASLLSDEDLAAVSDNLQLLESLDLDAFVDPFFRDNRLTFEMFR